MNPESAPFFSVVIFTKNRSDIIGCCLQSVLNQTYDDFEVIVSDNDDTDATERVISKTSDPRLRYHRTNGNLSMVDNWENGISLARGKYVLSLTDRSSLKSYALSRIKSAIDLYREDVYVWNYDLLYDSLNRVEFAQRAADETVLSADLFKLFFSTPYDVYSSKLPRGLNSCHSRELLQRIRKSTGGRVFLPVAPDFNVAFLTLAHVSQVVMLNEPLFVWGYGSVSNGGGLYRKSPTIMRFIRDLNLSESDLSNEVPIKAIGIHNFLCNDLLSLKRRFPKLFQEVDFDLVSYFVLCRNEIDQYIPFDSVVYREIVSEWERALLIQSNEVIREVSANLVAAHKVSVPRKLWRRIYNNPLAREIRTWMAQVKQQEKLFPTKGQRFADIIEATRWIETREAGTRQFANHIALSNSTQS